jgi:hypothetical protein
LERNIDVVSPIPPKVETRRKATDEQLTHTCFEIMLKVEPGISEPMVSFKFCEYFNTYTFILTTTPMSIADIVERINPITASSGR